jgi:hypothetical protein
MPARGGSPIADADPATAETYAPLAFSPTAEPLTSEAQAVLANQSTQLCTVGDLAHSTSVVTKDGADQVVAVACSDPKLRKFEVALLVRAGGGLDGQNFNRVPDTDSITFTGFASSANELCVDFTANPSNENKRLCIRRKRR